MRGRRMNKDEIKKYEIRMGLECCSVIDSKAGCIDCPYRYRCGALVKDAHKIIIEQEKEIEQFTRELAKEQEACAECELKHSWKLSAREKEIDRLRAENERFENNMKSELEIEKKNVVKEFAEKLKESAIRLSEIETYHVCNLIDELLKEYEK